MSIFTFIPDQPLSKGVKIAVNRSQFGDGYSQRSTDGINSIGETLRLSFTLRTRTEINSIETFLSTENGVTSFEYTTPGSTMKKYTCAEWDATYYHDGNAELTCSFKREFEP